MSTILVKVNDQVKTTAAHKIVTQDPQPTIIKAVNKSNYELVDEATGHAPNHLLTKRVGNDLQVSFAEDSGNPDLIIEGFYDEADSALIGMAEDGSYYYYVPDSGEVTDFVTELEAGDIQGQALGGNAQAAPWWVGASETDSFNMLPWLAGLAGIGILGAALASSSDSDNKNDNTGPPADTTPPDAPTDLEVSDDGTTVTGKGEAGAKVEITDLDGNVIGEGVVDDNGDFEVELVPPQVDGEKIEATLTDPAGNTSDPADTTAPDLTAPDAPTDLVVSDDGSSISGNGEPGTKVEITDVDGNVIGEGTVGDDGSFEVPLTPPQIDNEKLEATLTDDAGNTSDPADAIAPDLTPPDAPTAEINPEGTLITGETEPGATVKVDTNGDGVPDYTVTADENGDYTVDTSDNPLVDGENIKVTATDDAGNQSKPTEIMAPSIDVSPPKNVRIGNGDDYITADEIDADGNVNVSVGLPANIVVGSIVTVNGSETSVTAADIAKGKIIVKVPAPTEDETLSASATITNPAGKVSDPVSADAVRDTLPPSAPEKVTIGNDGDNVITVDEIDNEQVDVIVKLPADAEVDDIVVVNGIETPITTEAIADGQVVVQVPAPAEGEELMVSATIKDPAGNVSDSVDANAIRDTATAPDAPENVTIGNNGDKYITADEIDGEGKVDVTVELPTDAVVGSTVIVNGIEKVLTAEDIDAGQVIVKLPAPMEGAELKASAIIKDPAGNPSESKSANAVRDTEAPSEPESVTIGNDGDAVITADEINNDNVDVTVGLPADAAVGDIVIVNGVEKPLTATDITKGEVVVKVPAPAEGKELIANATIKDPAGNVSDTVTANAIRDTATAPAAPDSVAIGNNGDAFITADEIDAAGNVAVTVVLPDDAVVGSTVVVNGNEKLLTAADIAAGQVVIKVPAPEEGEKLDAIAFIKNAAGKESARESASAERDTEAPDEPNTTVIVDDLTDDNVINGPESEADVAVTGSVSGEFTLGDAVTVMVNGKAYKGTVDSEGNFSIDVPGSELVADTDSTIEVTVAATDTAGNTGSITTDKKYVVNTDELIAAADNFVDFQLDAVPTETSNPLQSKTGFNLVSAGLGPVLGADVLAEIAESAIQLDVGENEVREVTMYGDSGGIQIGATSDLYVYKLNESTGQYEQQTVKEAWVVAYLLGGKGEETTFNLTEGKWMFVMAPGQGVSALGGYSLYITEDKTLDYGNAVSVSGSVPGNLLKDDDPEFGYDDLPANTQLTAVNGDPVSATGETVIVGQYGTLTVQANGEYEYTVNEDFRGPYGAEEVFKYEVTSPIGNTSSAELTIKLDIIPAETQDFIERDTTLVVDIESKVTLDTDDSEIADAIGFAVVDLGLVGPVLDVGALGGQPTMDFSVGDNQVRELTFHGSGGGVSVAQFYSLLIYKLDETTGSYVQVHQEKDWFVVPLLGGVSEQLTLQFGEGEYKAILGSNGGLGVLSGNGLYVDHDKIYDYNQPVKFSGTLTGDITEDDNTVLVKVNDKLVEAGDTTTVKGEYGTLVIETDGSYTYTVNKPDGAGADWLPPYGKVDAFQFTSKDANGKAAVEKLNIKIGTHTAADDFNTVTVPEQNVVSDIQFNRDFKAVGNYGDSMEESFKIADNQVASATLKVQTSALEVTYTLTNTTTGEVFTGTETAASRGVSLDIALDNLPPGEYNIQINSSGGGPVYGNIKGYQFVTTLIHTDEYTTSAIDPVTGVLLENDTGLKNVAELKIATQELYVSDPAKGAQSIEIEGLYGTLTVNKDGSYEYVPTGEAYGIERFDYETVSVTGTKEKATLEINVGKAITASIHDDIAVSSAADDVFIMGEGADTLIFNNLNGTEGGNGNNGLDQWTDFSAAQGDMIDIRGLLDGNQTSSNIEDYLKYEDGVLIVDRNGNAEFESLLKVSATDLDELILNIKWQADAPDTTGFASRTMSDDADPMADSAPEMSLMAINDESDTLSLAEADLFRVAAIDMSDIGANTVNVDDTNGGSAAMANVDYIGGDNDDAVYIQGSNWHTTEPASTRVDGGGILEAEGTTSSAAPEAPIYEAWHVDSSLAPQMYIDTDMTNII
jgi:VCBS repeat-containing protein